MTDRQLHKIAAGNYTVAGYNVIRNRGEWILLRPDAQDETYSNRRLAVLSARILAGVASQSEIDEYRFAQEAK